MEEDSLDADYQLKWKKSAEIDGSMVEYEILKQEKRQASNHLDQLDDALARATFNPEFGKPKLNELEIANGAHSAGPFASRYLLVSGLLGALVFPMFAYLVPKLFPPSSSYYPVDEEYWGPKPLSEIRKHPNRRYKKPEPL